MSESSGSSRSEGVEAVDHPQGSASRALPMSRRKWPSEVAAAAADSRMCGSPMAFSRIWKFCGFGRKGGQTMLLTDCLARYGCRFHMDCAAWAA
eukprot:350989-Chlamydomonas_euryale.AAC.4